MFIRRVVAVAATAFAVAATGCSSPSNAPTDAGNHDEIQLQLEWARASGASDNQIQVLENALEIGEVTYGQLETLFSDVYECFDEVGWTYSIQPPRELAPGSGILVPDYLAFPPQGMSEDAALELFDACNNENIAYALAAYSSQPVALEALFESWDTPELRECLESRGYNIDENTTPAEVNALVSEDVAANMNDPSFTVCVP